MAQAVAAALRVRPRPGLSTAGSIVEFLRTKNALVVLDNCEHLPGAPAVLAAGILRSCRGVRLLATSRQALSVEGEQVFGLRPLPLPPPDAGVAAAAASDAVCLFVQRAAAARRDFALTPANVAAVGEVCRRLDGIPLAIELAAARVAALRPAEIAGLLDERFRLLTGGRADAAARQQTLQATVEWSYALLGQAERRVFDCLGVFPGSFDAAAAADIAAADGLQRWDILDSLTSLVGKSLVAEEEGPGQTSRYRLLETMRAYARQHLAAAGEPGRLQHRHAEHYAAFAETAGPELLGRAQLQWQQRIRAERDNLQAAVTWALTSGGQARPLAFRIVAALAAFAITSPGTVRGWAEACAAQIGACPPELRAPVIAAAAWSALYAGDVPLAQRRAEGALQDPAAGDPLSLGLLRAVLSLICMLTGQPERGASIAREGRQEAAEQGIEILVGELLAMEARAWTTAGDRAAARRPAMEAVEAARRVQNPGLSAVAFYAAAAAIWPGDPQTALMLIEDSLALTRAGASDIILGRRPDVGWHHPGPDRRPARSAGRAAGSDGATTRRRQPAVARHHARGRRRGAGPARRSRTGRGAGRSLLGAFHAGHLCRSQRRADGDRRSPVPRPPRARRGRLQRRARPGRRDGRRRGRRLRAGRVPAARLPARGTRRAGTGITTGARRGRPAGNDRITRQVDVPQHSWRGQAPPSFQPARGRRPPGPPARQADVALAAASAAGQHWRTEVLLRLPALPAACDRHAEPRTPERADLREATRTDGAGISRAESAIRSPGRYG